MADQNEQAQGAEQQQAAPLVIHGQYIKDLSFEVPKRARHLWQK